MPLDESKPAFWLLLLLLILVIEIEIYPKQGNVVRWCYICGFVNKLSRVKYAAYLRKRLPLHVADVCTSKKKISSEMLC